MSYPGFAGNNTACIEISVKTQKARVVYMKKISFLLVIILLSYAMPCFAGTQSSKDKEIWNYSQEIAKFADPIVENLVIRLNNENYILFSKDFNPKMKEAMTEAKYKEMLTTIKSKYGDYISKEFLNAEINDNYIIVSYKGKFSLEKDIKLIRVILVHENSQTYVAGFWLNTLKLVGNINNQQ